MVWSLATQFNVDNTIADQWFLHSHVFTKRWLIIHVESDEIPETWESVGYAIPAYLLNNDSLPGIDDSWVIGGDDRDNRYRLLPLKAQELVTPFEQGQAYRLYFRFVRYMRNATISVYENDKEPAYGNGGTSVVNWADIQGDKDYNDLVNRPDLSGYLSLQFEDTVDLWTAAAPIDFNHGITEVIKLVTVDFVCKTNGHHQFNQGSVLPFSTSYYYLNQYYYNSTEITVYPENVSFRSGNNSSGARVAITSSNWSVRVRAYI
jgi:hypothetical protein